MTAGNDDPAASVVGDDERFGNIAWKPFYGMFASGRLASCLLGSRHDVQCAIPSAVFKRV